MKLNLSGAKRVIESLMEGDECIITRDTEGTGDDVWSSATGTYAPPPNDTTTIYSGKCIVSNSGSGSTAEYGGEYFVETTYWLTVPLEADELRSEDIVTVTASLRDPELIDKIFLIKEPLFTTFAVSRRVRMELLQEVPGAA